MYKDLIKELKKNTDVMESTFRKHNLKVVQFNYKPVEYADDNNDADCYILIELATLSGDSIDTDYKLKVNMYDEDGNIILTEDKFIDSDSFEGYDTFEIGLFNNSRTLIDTKSARIFLTKDV